MPGMPVMPVTPVMSVMRALRGPLVFLGVAAGLTALAAFACDPSWALAATPPSTRLLRASLLYALVVGWPPVVAFVIARRLDGARGVLDDGVRVVPRRFSAIAFALPVSILLAAAALDALVWHAPAGAPVAAVAGTWDLVASAALALCGVIAVLWLQSVGEELTWRGYLLPRLMQRVGAWPGLVLHGTLWGICHAPVLLAVGGDGALARVGAFVVTCALLGTLLGWLRLAARSIFASAASNALLTVCGGLPLVLGGAPPALAAVYEPAGWIPMLVVIAVIGVRGSLRAAVTIPYRRLPEHVN